MLLYHKSKGANVSKAESGMLYHGMDKEASKSLKRSTWHSSVVLVARVKTACLVGLVCITSNRTNTPHFKIVQVRQTKTKKKESEQKLSKNVSLGIKSAGAHQQSSEE